MHPLTMGWHSSWHDGEDYKSDLFCIAVIIIIKPQMADSLGIPSNYTCLLMGCSEPYQSHQGVGVIA